MSRLFGTAVVILVIASATLAGQAPQLERDADGVIRFAGWQEPGSAFAIRDVFINNEFLSAEATDAYPANAIMGFSGGACPHGWTQHTDDDGTPLFWAFGLFVDAEGTPRSEFVKVPACVKQH